MKILNRKLNVVIVAGASGIGREIAAAYDREKCNVFVCDISDSFIQSFHNDYPNIFIKKADVSVYDDVAKFFKQVQSKQDSIDVPVSYTHLTLPTNREV